MTPGVNTRTIKNSNSKINNGGLKVKGFIQDQAIILTEPLPENFQDGDEVEIAIVQIKKKIYPFPTFDFGIRDEYLSREKIYESDSNLS